MTADVRPLVRDERHLRAIVLAVRKRRLDDARKAFVRDTAGSVASLIDAQEKYIAALEAVVADR